MQQRKPSHQGAASATEPARILIRGVNWLGDAVMTTPALLRLRERFSNAFITLFTHEKLAPLWARHPALDAILTFCPKDSPWFTGRRLRAEPFDLALILPNSHRAALECWFAKVPERVGYVRPWRNWFLTRAIPVRSGSMPMKKKSAAEIQRLIHKPGPDLNLPARSHQLYEYLHLAAALGCHPEPLAPTLYVEPNELTEAGAKFGLGVPSPESPPLFALNPGAEYGPAKRWPVENFVAAARAIQSRTGCRWVILGGSADVPLASQIQAGIGGNGVQTLAGRTSLRELCAVLKLCRVLLTNDTGPMHVAAALGTPVVVPFGSTSPALTGPGLPGDSRHRLVVSMAPCSPCFRRTCPIDFRCMKSIAVQGVIDAVLQVASQSELHSP